MDTAFAKTRRLNPAGLRMRRLAGLAFVLSATACTRTPASDLPRAPAPQASERAPGGATSTRFEPAPSFALPAANLPESARPHFYAGRALAHQPWVKAPTTTDARDGLGPLYNARTCLACHVNGGRGRVPESSHEMLVQGVVALSVPGRDPIAGVVPEPRYGAQLQSQSVALAHQLRAALNPVELASLGRESTGAAPEAYPYLRYTEEDFVYPDGHVVALRRPSLELRDLNYGAMSEQVRTSVRVAPPILGAGLIDAIPQSAIHANEDPNDRDGDGISGRVNQVWDFDAKKPAPGRFGWKANRANLRIQVAAALAGDMGITNPVFPKQPCSSAQTACALGPHGPDANGHEINEKLLELVVEFNRNLGVPLRRKADHPMVQRGRTVFYAANCQSCHAPSYVTRRDEERAQLSEQTIWPYSDFLLHDMGPNLADGRDEYAASGSEWRTAPLWGVGLSRAVNGAAGLLHDGRARTVEQAILWHGGEARTSREHFVALPSDDRAALIAFVKSL
ncbi:MAG: di-heme oxidoredictase family protein [Myxococcota bacterium]